MYRTACLSPSVPLHARHLLAFAPHVWPLPLPSGRPILCWLLPLALLPDPELEYEHLARGVRAALQRDPGALCAGRLAEMTGPEVQELLGWPRAVPLQEERARLLREVW